MVHTGNQPDEEDEAGGSQVQGQSGLHFWAGGVVQVIEHLPRKGETLSSSPSTAKKKKIAMC
jgi:hypothetical protein